MIGTPAGGVFSGDGVIADTFYPKNVVVGLHVISYDYTDGNGCSSSDTSVIEVSECTGIEEQFAAGISIYPNPFRGSFMIQSASMPIETVIVYDVVGKEVLRAESIDGLQKHIELPVSLAKGIYHVRVISEADAVIGRKLIRVE